jgi:UDP-GlcNAc:undecaprenyl-phosphate GlcNAc-1-phosphate transferase
MPNSLLISLIYVFILSFGITYLAIPLIIKFAHKINAVDQPDHRKVHKTSMPRLGGLAMYFAFIIVAATNLLIHKPIIGIMLGATLIIIVGVLDDIFSLKPLLKFALQIAIAIITYQFGIGIQFITSPFGGIVYLGWFSLPLTVFWIIGMINTINLIDGLDGLAGGVVAISAAVIAIVAFGMGQIQVGLIAISILGTCLAFLKYNFSPAKIFMGDSGSMFLGYILAVTTLMGVMKSTIAMSLAIPIIMLGIPIGDTLIAIIRRIKNKQHIMQADKGHLHHRLLNLGLTQKQAVILIYIGSIILGCFALLVFKLLPH